MEEKKIKKKKLTLTASPKRPLTVPRFPQSNRKKSVIIEKKTGKFSNRSSFVNRPYNKNTNFRGKTFSTSEKTPFSKLKQTPSRSNDYEKRKLAEQRATKRLKDDSTSKDSKGKIINIRNTLGSTVCTAKGARGHRLNKAKPCLYSICKILLNIFITVKKIHI